MWFGVQALQLLENIYRCIYATDLHYLQHNTYNVDGWIGDGDGNICGEDGGGNIIIGVIRIGVKKMWEGKRKLMLVLLKQFSLFYIHFYKIMLELFQRKWSFMFLVPKMSK